VKRLSLFHPLLWAAYPVLFLYAHNLLELRFESVFMPLLATVAAAGVLYGVLSLVLRGDGRAALIVSLLCIGFFSYGHVYLWLEQTGIARHRFLMPAWLLWMGGGTWWLLRTKRPLDALNGFAFVVAVVLLATTSFEIATGERTTPASAVDLEAIAARDPALPAPAPGDPLPDVYYILLDAYGGEHSLEHHFGFDNHEFLDGLRRRGFFVADRSMANYMITHLVMASILNMTYLDSLTDRVGTDSRSLHVLNTLIRHNRVERLLGQMGYESVIIHSPADLSARDFPNLLMQTSMAAYWTSIEHQRSQTLEAFRMLEELPPSTRPRFVYAHVVCPHGPYVFAPDGGKIQGLEWKRTLSGAEGLRARYVGQVQFVNRRVEAIVDRILAQSKTPPIIILQGDHGPIAGENLEVLTPTLIDQRAPVLNAILLPGGPEGIPADLAPVNTFRLVFDRAFGAELPMLEAGTWYSHGKRPFRLTPVTDQLPK